MKLICFQQLLLKYNRVKKIAEREFTLKKIYSQSYSNLPMKIFSLLNNDINFYKSSFFHSMVYKRLIYLINCSHKSIYITC
jgi:hypothetical protein